jgi:hypothetical protein
MRTTYGPVLNLCFKTWALSIHTQKSAAKTTYGRALPCTLSEIDECDFFNLKPEVEPPTWGMSSVPSNHPVEGPLTCFLECWSPNLNWTWTTMEYILCILDLLFIQRLQVNKPFNENFNSSLCDPCWFMAPVRTFTWVDASFIVGFAVRFM